MNLLKKYKKLKYEEKIEFIRLIKDGLKHLELMEHYMTFPNIKVKEKSVKTD